MYLDPSNESLFTLHSLLKIKFAQVCYNFIIIFYDIVSLIDEKHLTLQHGKSMTMDNHMTLFYYLTIITV